MSEWIKCSFYSEMAYRLSDGKFNKLDATRICDAIGRLRDGEYIIIANPNECREIE